MRLIDADELLEKMYRYTDNEGAKMPYGDNDSLIHKDSACFLIENAPTIEPEPHWIPCSERLPEPRIDVWCNSDMGQMVGYYEENVKTWYGRDYLELMVTAWMPLPEPYRGEEK